MDDREIIQLTLWRLREFFREPEALFWIFAFPLLLAIALGLAFDSRGVETIPVGVVQATGSEKILDALSADPGIVPAVGDSAEVHDRLRTGKLALVVSAGDPVVFTYDSTRAESRMARMRADQAIQTAAGRENPQRIREAYVSERGSRYIDFLIPGLLGLNIMGTGMWGVGFGIVKDRMNKLLKRLLASPMRRRNYMMSHILSRMTFLVIEVTAILGFGAWVYNVPQRGSFILLLGVIVLGALAFAALGLLVASRQKTIEGVSGLMNLVMVPMWIGSGVFFSYSNFPEAVHPFLKMLPLTALNDSLRALMLEGAGAEAILGPVGVLLFWLFVAFFASLWLFRWK